MLLQSSSSQPLMTFKLQAVSYNFFSKLVDWLQTWTKPNSSQYSATK
jgi:hypothetical protein